MSAVSVTEQTISAALQRLAPEQWPQVLAFIDSLSEGATPALQAGPDRRWSASELRKLPPAERRAILESQAALIENDYRHDAELTGFEAFGEKDLYVDDSDTEAR
jgi:hypothetical protein